MPPAAAQYHVRTLSSPANARASPSGCCYSQSGLHSGGLPNLGRTQGGSESGYPLLLEYKGCRSGGAPSGWCQVDSKLIFKAQAFTGLATACNWFIA